MSVKLEAQGPEGSAHRVRPATGVALALFAATFLLFGATSATHARDQLNLDAWSANYESWTLATTGSPWIDLEAIPPLRQNPIRDQWVTETPDGHTVIARAPGVVAVALPAYWLVRPGAMTTAPGALTAALMMAGAVVLLFGALRRSLPVHHAVLGSLAFGFTTPVWSVGADDVWPHTVTVFAICGLAYGCATNRWWWVGFFGGILVWGRVHAAVIVAIVGLYVAWRRRSPRLTLTVAAMGSVFMVMLCVWTRWMYGTWSPTGSYDTSTFEAYASRHRFSVVNQLGFWISPDRGILIWTPVVLLMVPALVRAWKSLPDWATSLAIGGITYTCLQGILNRFSGGDLFYGYRYGLEALACLAPALALSTPHLGRIARLLLGPVLAIRLLAIAVGAASNSLFLPEQEKWHANAFVTAVNTVGILGWVIVLLTACIGAYAQLLWRKYDSCRLHASGPQLDTHGLASTPDSVSR